MISPKVYVESLKLLIKQSSFWETFSELKILEYLSCAKDIGFSKSFWLIVTKCDFSKLYFGAWQKVVGQNYFSDKYKSLAKKWKVLASNKLF